MRPPSGARESDCGLEGGKAFGASAVLATVPPPIVPAGDGRIVQLRLMEQIPVGGLGLESGGRPEDYWRMANGMKPGNRSGAGW